MRKMSYPDDKGMTRPKILADSLRLFMSQIGILVLGLNDSDQTSRQRTCSFIGIRTWNNLVELFYDDMMIYEE